MSLNALTKTVPWQSRSVLYFSSNFLPLLALFFFRKSQSIPLIFDLSTLNKTLVTIAATKEKKREKKYYKLFNKKLREF